MIAAAVCIGSREQFERYARPALARALPGDSPVGEITTDSICAGYNEALDAFGSRPDLEALVLMHEDVSIEDSAFVPSLQVALAEPGVELVGVIGAMNVRSLCWWEDEIRGRVSETRGLIDHWTGVTDVDSVDGLLMVLSPWAVRNLRFDAATFMGFHGYDVDFGLQVRAAGHHVKVLELAVTHHTHGGIGNAADFWSADRALRAKWSARGRPMASDEEMDPRRRRFAVQEQRAR